MDRPSVSNWSDRSATKRSVQQSSVNRPVHSEHSPVTPVTHRSELEHGLASNRTRHRSDVSRSSWRNSSTHRATIPLRHADPSEHSTASVLRHHRVRSRSHSYDSVFLRLHSRASSRSRGKKKKLHRRGNTLSLLVLLIATPPPLLLEKEQGNGTSLKEETH